MMMPISIAMEIVGSRVGTNRDVLDSTFSGILNLCLGRIVKRRAPMHRDSPC